jgi:hypothetical protein
MSFQKHIRHGGAIYFIHGRYRAFTELAVCKILPPTMVSREKISKLLPLESE